MSALDQLRQLQGGFDSQSQEISDMINAKSSSFQNNWRSKANEAVKLRDDLKEQTEELLTNAAMAGGAVKGLYTRVKTVRANRAAIRAGKPISKTRPATDKEGAEGDDDLFNGESDDGELFPESEQGSRSVSSATLRDTAARTTGEREAADVTRAANRVKGLAAAKRLEEAKSYQASLPDGRRWDDPDADREGVADAADEDVGSAVADSVAGPVASGGSSLSSVPDSLSSIPEEASGSDALFGGSLRALGGGRSAFGEAGRLNFNAGSSFGMREQPDFFQRLAGRSGARASVNPSSGASSSFSTSEDGANLGSGPLPPAAPPVNDDPVSAGPRSQRSNSMDQEDKEDVAGADDDESKGGGDEDDDDDGGGSNLFDDDEDDAELGGDEVLGGGEAAEAVGSSVALGAGTETAIGLASDVLGPVGLLAGIGFAIAEAVGTSHTKPHDPPPQEALSTSVSRHSLVLPSIDGVVDTPASMSAF